MTDTTASTERSMMRAYHAVNEAGLTDQGTLYLLGYLIAAAPKTAMAGLDRLRARTADDPAARRRFFTAADNEGPEHDHDRRGDVRAAENRGA